jgi:hypothetical protein
MKHIASRSNAALAAPRSGGYLPLLATALIAIAAIFVLSAAACIVLPSRLFDRFFERRRNLRFTIPPAGSGARGGGSAATLGRRVARREPPIGPRRLER